MWGGETYNDNDHEKEALRQQLQYFNKTIKQKSQCQFVGQKHTPPPHPRVDDTGYQRGNQIRFPRA